MTNILQPQNEIARGLGGGILGACLFLLAFFGLPFFSQFCLLPIFYIGLRDGLKNAALSSGIAFIFIFFASNFAFAITFLILFLLPGLYLVSKSLLNRSAPDGTQEWHPAGHLVIQATIVGLVIMGLAFIFLNVMVDEQKIKQLYDTAQSRHLSEFAALKISFENMVSLIKISPGLTGLGFFLTLAMNGMLAQKILIHQQKNLRPAPDIKTLEMPSWPWVGLAICGIIALLFHSRMVGGFALNVVLVLAGAFMLQGISIFHVFCEGKPHSKLYLGGFYFLLLVFPWLVISICIAGVFEPWLNLRQKIKGNFRS